MLKRSYAALAAALSLFVAGPAVADYTFSAGGQTITQGATVVGGRSRSHVILYDAAGNPVLTSGNPGYFSLAGPIPAGTNAIGSVSVTALPALPAGTNTIGSIANITGAVPLPSGAATAAYQATANTSLATVATNTAGLATAAGQSTGNFSLGSIDAKTPALVGGREPVDTVVQGTSSDVGGTITTGGTAQTFAAGSASRRGIVFQNQSTGDLRINCLGVAATLDFHSLLIPAGALYSTDPHHVGTLACSVIGATTGQAWYARTF